MGQDGNVPPVSLHVELLSLGLADNRIGDEGALALADLLRQSDTLQRLVLSGNEIGDEGGSKLVASLSQNCSLKGLYLAGVSSDAPCMLCLTGQSDLVTRSLLRTPVAMQWGRGARRWWGGTTVP